MRKEKMMSRRDEGTVQEHLEALVGCFFGLNAVKWCTCARVFNSMGETISINLLAL